MALSFRDVLIKGRVQYSGRSRGTRETGWKDPTKHLIPIITHSIFLWRSLIFESSCQTFWTNDFLPEEMVDPLLPFLCERVALFLLLSWMATASWKMNYKRGELQILVWAQFALFAWEGRCLYEEWSLLYRHLQRQHTFTATVEFPQQLTSEHEHNQLVPPSKINWTLISTQKLAFSGLQ